MHYQRNWFTQNRGRQSLFLVSATQSTTFYSLTGKLLAWISFIIVPHKGVKLKWFQLSNECILFQPVSLLLADEHVTHHPCHMSFLLYFQQASVKKNEKNSIEVVIIIIAIIIVIIAHLFYYVCFFYFYCGSVTHSSIDTYVCFLWLSITPLVKFFYESSSPNIFSCSTTWLVSGDLVSTQSRHKQS